MHFILYIGKGRRRQTAIAWAVYRSEVREESGRVRARGAKSKTGLYTQMGQNSTSKANISQHYTSWDRLSILKVNTYYMG